MDDFTSKIPDEVIRISKKEANSPHVDDLLKRQMSLRGDLGITRSHKRCWYYQNWFVFMVVGALAGIAGWAIIEPFFDDHQYFQGKIEKVDVNERMPSRFTFGDMYIDLSFPGRGYIIIKGQKIWLLEQVKEIRPDGTNVKLDTASLQPGREVGVYVEYLEANRGGIAVCLFVDLSPAPQPPSKASMTISQLAARTNASGMLLFPVVAGLIGLAIGSVDGIICKLLRRALLSGGVGLLVGFIGGFLSAMLAGLIYLPMNRLAVQQMGETLGSFTPFGFFVQMTGRGLAWCLAGIAMGLGQGIALRSKRLLLYGFLGGIIGGLLGGLLFDPIDLLILGVDKPSSHWSRLIGLGVIGACVGVMIGVVELLARDAWLQMTRGPLAGKEFLIFKDMMNVGASPKNDIYLFNDPLVADVHVRIQTTGDTCEVQNIDKDNPALLNGRPVTNSRLRHGDHITIGKTEFVFQTRRH
jgi:hypothetical protein